MKRVTGTYVESSTLGEVIKAFVPFALPPQKPSLSFEAFNVGRLRAFTRAFDVFEWIFEAASS